MNRASKRSKNNLFGVNDKLVMLVGYALAISEQDFFVNEGLRSTETQQDYFKKGVTQRDGIIKKSEHQLGRAIDVYYTGWTNKDDINDIRWNKIYDAFKTASKMLNINIVFGAEWKSFVDKPHIELAKDEE